MKIEKNRPPREFQVGVSGDITFKDCGSIILESDEQRTFKTNKNAEYDVCRKSWGFYATPSLNKRLKGFGLKGVLVRNRNYRYYVMLVEENSENEFNRYLKAEQLKLVCRLDRTAEL